MDNAHKIEQQQRPLIYTLGYQMLYAHFSEGIRTLLTGKQGEGSAGLQDIAFYVFSNGVGGHFKDLALQYFSRHFQKSIGAYFSLKRFC